MNKLIALFVFAVIAYSFGFTNINYTLPNANSDEYRSTVSNASIVIPQIYSDQGYAFPYGINTFTNGVYGDLNDTNQWSMNRTPSPFEDAVIYGVADEGTCSARNVQVIGNINGGTFIGTVNFYIGIISGGTFNGQVHNMDGAITGGTFIGRVMNNWSINGATFKGLVENYSGIYGGTFTNIINYGYIDTGAITNTGVTKNILE